MKFFYISIVLLCLNLGCSSKQDYYDTVKDGIKTVPHVREIKQVFPNYPADHFISMFGHNQNKPVRWNTQIFFGGKYTFTYQVDVLIDYRKNNIIKTVTNPTFSLEVASKITIDPRGRPEAFFDGGHNFGEEDWNKVVAAKGDFSVIGINLITNAPLRGFPQYVDATRIGRTVVVE